MNNSDGKIKVVILIKKKSMAMPARLTRGARRVGAHVQRKRASTLPAAPLVLKALKEAQRVFWLLGKNSKKKKRPRGRRLKGLKTLKHEARDMKAVIFSLSCKGRTCLLYLC